MSEVVELFGVPTDKLTADWEKIISDQLCPFTQKICFKGRKSEPEIKIGTCTVRNGKDPTPWMWTPGVKN